MARHEISQVKLQYLSKDPAPPPDDPPGISGLRSWNAIYIFVVVIFILWVLLLNLLTRTFS